MPNLDTFSDPLVGWANGGRGGAMELRQQRLARLEASTGRLVKLVAELRDERNRLREQLRDHEHETAQLRKDVTALRQERDIVRTRLAAIDRSLTKALAIEPTARAGKQASSRSDESTVEELTLFS